MTTTDLYREWDPPAEWRTVVMYCWEQRVAAEKRQRIVPDGCADLLFWESGATEVVGLFDEADVAFLASGTRLRGIRFRPEAVGALFGIDAASLRNRTVALDDVVGARRARLLGHPDSLHAWISTVQPDHRAGIAVALLARHSVALAADRMGMSTRQLRRITLTEIGLPPKTYQRVIRFQRFLSAAESQPGLAIAAAYAGYTDQAHLTRDVSALTGLTPSSLLAERAQAS
jgi:AraC-like DNA-binding protein